MWTRLHALVKRPYRDKRLTFFNRLAWELYPKFVRLVALLTGKPWRRDPDFIARGCKQGILPSSILEMLQKAVAAAPEKQMLEDDYFAGYLHHNGLRQPAKETLERQTNRSHTFIAIETCPAEVIRGLVEALQRPLTECLGTSWRILNLKCWKTIPAALAVGMNAWHTDGMPLVARKVMVYLTGASKRTGTTELNLPDGSTTVIEGPPGTWLFFKNSELMHRGVAPVTGSRTLLELTIGPALSQGYDATFGGTNGMYPVNPWTRPKPRMRTLALEDSIQAA
jgi:hypothetical protein